MNQSADQNPQKIKNKKFLRALVVGKMIAHFPLWLLFARLLNPCYRFVGAWFGPCPWARVLSQSGYRARVQGVMRFGVLLLGCAIAMGASFSMSGEGLLGGASTSFPLCFLIYMYVNYVPIISIYDDFFLSRYLQGQDFNSLFWWLKNTFP